MNRGNRRDSSQHDQPRPFSRPPATQTDDKTSAENRRKLEALFSKGNLANFRQPDADHGPRPVSSPVRVFSSPRRAEGKRISEYKLRLETLRNARAPEDIERAADVFLKHHQLPDDMEILLKLLQHPAEKVQREAMGEISSLLFQGRLSNTFLLADRLEQLALRELEQATRDYVVGLQGQIAARAKEA